MLEISWLAPLASEADNRFREIALVIKPRIGALVDRGIRWERGTAAPDTLAINALDNGAWAKQSIRSGRDDLKRARIEIDRPLHGRRAKAGRYILRIGP